MYQPSFNGAWAKVERAKNHREALYDHIAEAFAREADRPRLSTKFNHRTGEHEAYVSHMPDVEWTLAKASAMLGDVVQNLRNALNLLAFELALKNLDGSFPSWERERRVQFPIEDKPSTFEERCRPKPSQERSGWIADLAESDWAIFDEYQPYHRRHPYTYVRANRLYHPLADLRDLSDADKHKRLTELRIPPTRVDSRSPELQMIVYSHMQRQPHGGPYRVPFVELGTVLFHAIMPDLPKSEVEVAGYITPEVTLTDGRGALNVADGWGKIVVMILGRYSPIPDWVTGS